MFSIGFDVNDLEMLRIQLTDRHKHNQEQILRFAISGKAQDEIDRHKLIGQNEILIELLASIRTDS